MASTPFLSPHLNESTEVGSIRSDGMRNNTIQVTVLHSGIGLQSSSGGAIREPIDEPVVTPAGPVVRKPTKAKKIHHEDVGPGGSEPSPQQQHHQQQQQHSSLSLFAQYPANLIHFTPGERSTALQMWGCFRLSVFFLFLSLSPSPPFHRISSPIPFPFIQHFNCQKKKKTTTRKNMENNYFILSFLFWFPTCPAHRS